MTAEGRPRPPGPSPAQRWPGPVQQAPAGHSVSATPVTVLASRWPSPHAHSRLVWKGRRFETFKAVLIHSKHNVRRDPQGPRSPDLCTQGGHHPTAASGPLLDASFSMRPFTTATPECSSLPASPPAGVHPARHTHVQLGGHPLRQRR